MGLSEEKKYKAQLELSEFLNDTGAYNKIQNIAILFFGKEIDNDSDFWNELEENIIDMIEQHEE